MLQFVLSAFATVFVTVGPIDVAAIFLVVTPGLSTTARFRIASPGILTGTVVLLVFAIAGSRLLHLLGIGLPAFRAAGGLLLLKMSSDLLFQHHSQMSSLTKGEEDEAIAASSIAVFPIAIPMIAGPGSVSAVVLLMGKAHDWLEQIAVLGSIVVVAAVTFPAMTSATRLIAYLGLTGVNVIARISGLILAGLAMQFVFDGLKEAAFFA